MLNVYHLALELLANIAQKSTVQKSLLQCTDIVDFRNQKLTGTIKKEKDKQVKKLKAKPTSLQPSSSTRKLKVPKQPVYWSSLINGFNVKLQRDTSLVKSLDETDKDEPKSTPINTLLDTASFDT